MFQKLSLVCLIFASTRHKGRQFTTITKNQCFFKVTIAIDGMVPAQPLGPMVFDGFSVSQSLVTMFFNGCQPLVQRCDGSDTSFRSSLASLILQHQSGYYAYIYHSQQQFMQQEWPNIQIFESHHSFIIVEIAQHVDNI